MSWLLVVMILALVVVVLSGAGYSYSRYNTGGGTVIEEHDSSASGMMAFLVTGILVMFLIIAGLAMGWFTPTTNRSIPFTGPGGANGVPTAPANGGGAPAVSGPATSSSSMPNY
jgi:preprotein translocase subunit SecG